MRSMYRLVLTAALVAAPVALAAQQPPAPPAGARAGGQWNRPGADGGPGFQFLLRHRAELKLSDAQVQQIQTIGQELQTANAPLREKVRSARQAQRPQLSEQQRQALRDSLRKLTPEQRRSEMQKLREQHRTQAQLPPELQPTVQQMRENGRKALERLQAVLTPEQRTQARQLAQQYRGQRQGRMNAAPGRGRMHGDGMRPGQGRRGGAGQGAPGQAAPVQGR